MEGGARTEIEGGFALDGGRNLVLSQSAPHLALWRLRSTVLLSVTTVDAPGRALTVPTRGIRNGGGRDGGHGTSAVSRGLQRSPAVLQKQPRRHPRPPAGGALDAWISEIEGGWELGLWVFKGVGAGEVSELSLEGSGCTNNPGSLKRRGQGI